MAVDNIKDFGIQWIILGVLFFSLLSFTMGFIFLNNEGALGSSEDILESSRQGFQSKLVVLEEDSNSLLNITSKTNPEAGFLGTRDSVATAYGVDGNARGFLETTKIFMGWIFTGTSGQILVAVFGGIFIFTALYFAIKQIRNGL